jgi:hypothetical protein
MALDATEECNHKSHEEFVFLYGAKNYIPNSIRKTWPSSFADNAKKKLHPRMNDAPLSFAC